MATTLLFTHACVKGNKGTISVYSGYKEATQTWSNIFFLPPPTPTLATSGSKATKAENILAKDVYTWGHSLSIPPNEITFHNLERCGGENCVSARSMVENV